MQQCWQRKAAARALGPLCWAAQSRTSAVPQGGCSRTCQQGFTSKPGACHEESAWKGSGGWSCHQQECLGSPWQCIVCSFEGAECEAMGVLSVTSQESMRPWFFYVDGRHEHKPSSKSALYFSEGNTISGSHSEIFCICIILWDQHVFFKLVHVDLRLGNILMVSSLYIT